MSVISLRLKDREIKRINEATDTDSCLILAGTSMKVIHPLEWFSNGVERLR